MVRSPFFYVGDKYKLMPQLKTVFPENISSYYEPFLGGGSSLLNVNANSYFANDINSHYILLHKTFSTYCNKEDALLSKIYEIIDKYHLSCSYRNITVPDSLKKQYVKTYYSHYNKSSYIKLREDFNSKDEDPLLLYVLLIYGFNHMIRYNSENKFNLPVGNVDFNTNVYEAISNYLNFMNTHEVKFFCTDYKVFLQNQNFDTNSYVFCDPPYLISSSEYNKIWDEEKEIELYSVLDELNKNHIRFGITNLLHHKGETNEIFEAWSKKYISYSIKSNYISYYDNTIKQDSKELFVTNYAR